MVQSFSCTPLCSRTFAVTFLDSFLHLHRLPIATVQSHISQLFLLHHVRNTQQRRPPCQAARTTKPANRPLAFSTGEVGSTGISLTVRTQHVACGLCARVFVCVCERER